MKHKYYFILVAGLLLIITIGLFLANKYLLPLMPSGVNSAVFVLIAILLAVVALVAGFKDVVELLEKFHHRPPTVTTTNNRQVLLNKVRRFWVQGVLERSLHGAILLDLGMEYKPEAIQHPWDTVVRWPDQIERTLPSGTRIIEVFDESGGSLLILGEPGSGKTTALLELTRDLIVRFENNPDGPIPIVLNLSSWAESRKALALWIVDELNSKYQVPNRVTEAWLATYTLLPLLDGLDEVKVEYREACVTAINRFLQEQHTPIVVCSRIADYEALKNRLRFYGAIVQLPLTSYQIDRYLNSLGTKLHGARNAVRTDEALQRLAQSPLVLSIIAMAYQGLSMDDLKSGTQEERQTHLFTKYVEHMLNRKAGTPRFSAVQTNQQLMWLARKMSVHAQTVFHIEQLQPSWLSTNQLRSQFLHLLRLVIWIITGVASGVACGLSMGIVVDRIMAGVVIGYMSGLTSALGMWIAMTGDYPLKYRLLLGILTGSTMGLIVWFLLYNLILSLILGATIIVVLTLAFKRVGALATKNPNVDLLLSHINTTRKRLGWSWKTGIVGFINRIPIGIVFGLASGVTTGLLWGPFIGLIVGAILCLIFAIAGAISYGMIAISIQPKTIPNEGLWRSVENAVNYGLASGIVVGLGFGYIVGLLSNPSSGILTGAAFFMAGFVIGGIVAGGFPVAQHVILRLLLNRDAEIPINYMFFLEHCADHILLRRVGGGYIFVHRLLLEHFASLSSPRDRRSQG
jgi:hypothetical protein